MMGITENDSLGASVVRARQCSKPFLSHYKNKTENVTLVSVMKEHKESLSAESPIINSSDKILSNIKERVIIKQRMSNTKADR